MFLKSIIANTYFFIFFFGVIGYFFLIRVKRNRMYLVLLPFIFCWRFLFSLQSSRYSIIVSIPLIVFFAWFCLSNKDRYFYSARSILFYFSLIYFIVHLFFRLNDNVFPINAGDVFSSYSKRYQTITEIDHSDKNANRLSFYSGIPVYSSKQIFNDFLSGKDVFENEFYNYHLFNDLVLISFISGKEIDCANIDKSYQICARLFTNKKKNKSFLIFKKNTPPFSETADFTKCSMVVQTDFDKWVRYGYKYQVTDTSLLKPITHIPSGWTPLIGDGFYKNAYAVFENRTLGTNSFLHLSSKRECAFFTENCFRFDSDLLFSARIISLDDSKMNLLVCGFNKDRKGVLREKFFSFQAPGCLTIDNFRCVIPKNHYKDFPFVKIAFELQYGDILIDKISILSF